MIACMCPGCYMRHDQALEVQARHSSVTTEDQDEWQVMEVPKEWKPLPLIKVRRISDTYPCRKRSECQPQLVLWHAVFKTLPHLALICGKHSHMCLLTLFKHSP